MRIPFVLERLTQAGHLGRKSGAGFYLYESGKAIGVNPDATKCQFRKITTLQKPVDVLSDLMSTEAQRCLDEGVAESADAIDFAMVMGTGYAPFRGGPLRYQQTHSHSPSQPRTYSR